MFNKAEIIRQLNNDSQDVKTLEAYLKHHGVCLYTRLPFDGVGTLYWAQVKTYTSSHDKPKKVWRIVYETPWDCKPLLECPAETRLRVCRQLPALVLAIAAQVPEQIAKPLNQPRRVYHDGRQKKMAVALMVALLISIVPAEAKDRWYNFKNGIYVFCKQTAYDLDLYLWYTGNTAKRVCNVATGPLRWTLDLTGEFVEIKLNRDKAANVLYETSDFIELEVD